MENLKEQSDLLKFFRYRREDAKEKIKMKKSQDKIFFLNKNFFGINFPKKITLFSFGFKIDFT